MSEGGRRRTIAARVVLVVVALGFGLSFASLAGVLLSHGNVFLGVMAGIGALMTLWVGALSVWERRRG